MVCTTTLEVEDKLRLAEFCCAMFDYAELSLSTGRANAAFGLP